jgi:hypothetical protein
MLTVVQIQSLKPAERPFKVFDSDGLYLLVQPSGALLWRFRYRCCGIERKLSLGSFAKLNLRYSTFVHAGTAKHPSGPREALVRKADATPFLPGANHRALQDARPCHCRPKPPTVSSA